MGNDMPLSCGFALNKMVLLGMPFSEVIGVNEVCAKV